MKAVNVHDYVHLNVDEKPQYLVIVYVIVDVHVIVDVNVDGFLKFCF
jgi:hypothetical protein